MTGGTRGSICQEQSSAISTASIKRRQTLFQLRFRTLHYTCFSIVYQEKKKGMVYMNHPTLSDVVDVIKLYEVTKVQKDNRARSLKEKQKGEDYSARRKQAPPSTWCSRVATGDARNLWDRPMVWSFLMLTRYSRKCTVWSPIMEKFLFCSENCQLAPSPNEDKPPVSV